MKRVLKQQRRTLKEVSRETQIPYSTLHTWYENRQPKDIRKALRLAKHLSLTLQELLFDLPEEATMEIPKSTGEECFKGTFEITVRRIE